ncbi:MAG: hypothetical protein AAFV93_08995 [Chloroflexota bacterium]
MKPIQAQKIIGNPQSCLTFEQQYILLKERDSSSIIQAINILGDYGWDTVSLTVEGTAIYALVRNTNYKRKNR